MEPESDNLFSTLQKTFRRTSITRFLMGLLLILVLAVLAENITGYIFFMKMERKVSLLKELNELSQGGVSANSELKPIYLALVSELESYDTKPPLSISWSGVSFLTNIKLSETFLKFITGSLIGFLVAISGLYAKKEKRKEWFVIMFTGLSLGILLGYVAMMLPIIYNPWVNYLAFPSVQAIIIYIFLRSQRKKSVSA